jgi:hypothetical protein
MDLHSGVWAKAAWNMAAWDSAQNEMNNAIILIVSPNGQAKRPACRLK